MAGPSRRCCGTLVEQPGPPFRPLGAPRLDFCWFFNAPGRHQKTTIFRHRSKSIKIMNKAALGVPRHRFCLIFGPFWDRFGHRFFNVFRNSVNSRKPIKTMYFQWFCLSDPIIFRHIFRWFFMFCSEPLLESISGAQNGDLYSESRFLEPFRISRGPENGPGGDNFEPKGLQRASPFSGGCVLFATLLFTKPQ